MSDEIAKGSIKGTLSDYELQQLTAQTLHKTAQEVIPQRPSVLALSEEKRKAAQTLLTELTQNFRGAYIQGIINAEKSRWNNANDNLPSFDYLAPERSKEYQALYRALFTASLPFTYFANTGTAGFWVVGTATAVSYGLATLGFLSAPISLPFLSIAGSVFALTYLGISLTGIVKNPNTSVGRGQITGRAWEDAVARFGKYFNLDYFPKVLSQIHLSEKTQEFMRNKAINPNGVNSVSISFNPLGPNNMRIVDNFMIGAVLLDKMQDRHRGGQRSLEDTIKYGIATYKSSVGYLNGISQALGLDAPLQFFERASISDSRLDTEQQDTIRYVYEVYDHAQSH